MKNIVYAGVGLFALGVLLGIVQLWLHVLSADIFIKAELTIGSLILLMSVIRFVLKEQKEAKNTNSLDD